MTSECRLIDLDDSSGAGGGRTAEVFTPRREGVLYRVYYQPTARIGAQPPRFLVLTNQDGAVNFKIMSTPVTSTSAEHWMEVIFVFMCLPILLVTPMDVS
jgi:protease II